jgi:xanthine/uracil/vitamin C permease (AzgA family)
VEAERRKKKKRGYLARSEKGALFLSHDAPLPDVCMKCGAHDTIARRDVIFTWTPLWIRFLVFCGIGLFMRLILRRRASLVIPLCIPCNSRWSAARSANIAAIVAFVGVLVLARVLDASRLSSIIVLGTIAAIVLVRIFFVRPRVLQVHVIDEDTIAFKGVNADASREIVEGSRPVPQ